jgi:hypothetical protein
MPSIEETFHAHFATGTLKIVTESAFLGYAFVTKSA